MPFGWVPVSPSTALSPSLQIEIQPFQGGILETEILPYLIGTTLFSQSLASFWMHQRAPVLTSRERITPEGLIGHTR
jgi:hypothetical protein